MGVLPRGEGRLGTCLLSCLSEAQDLWQREKRFSHRTFHAFVLEVLMGERRS